MFISLLLIFGLLSVGISQTCDSQCYEVCSADFAKDFIKGAQQAFSAHQTIQTFGGDTIQIDGKERIYFPKDQEERALFVRIREQQVQQLRAIISSSSPVSKHEPGTQASDKHEVFISRDFEELSATRKRPLARVNAYRSLPELEERYSPITKRLRIIRYDPIIGYPNEPKAD